MRILATFGLLLTAAHGGGASAAELAVGDDAPAFEMVGSDGSTYRLSDFRDKQAVVVAWYPKAFTGG